MQRKRWSQLRRSSTFTPNARRDGGNSWPMTHVNWLLFYALSSLYECKAANSRMNAWTCAHNVLVYFSLMSLISCSLRLTFESVLPSSLFGQKRQLLDSRLVILFQHPVDSRDFHVFVAPSSKFGFELVLIKLTVMTRKCVVLSKQKSVGLT